MSATTAARPEVSAATTATGDPVVRTVGGVPVRSLLLDVLLVLGLSVVMVWEYTHPRMDDGLRPAVIDLPVSVVCSFLAFAPIVVRRIFPLTALVVAVGALTLPTALALPVDSLFWSGFAPVVFLVFSVARYRGLWVALLGVGFTLAAEAVGTLVGASDDLVSDTLFLLTFLCFAVLLGVAMRRSDRQRQQLVDLLARVRAEQADRERLAVAAERAGLARDLHDVVAHAVSLMLVQAGAARMSLREDPELARRFLAGVEQAGREASRDVSTLLTVLRTDEANPADPTPSLAALPALVERMRRAGLDVDVQTSGSLAEIPGGLDGTAYRIAQESLTNVTKHAGPTRVDLQVARRDDHLELSIRDGGPAGPRPAPARSGHGLAGLRERAALFGGTVEAGPDGPGFLVRAWLPWPEPT